MRLERSQSAWEYRIAVYKSLFKFIFSKTSLEESTTYAKTSICFVSFVFCFCFLSFYFFICFCFVVVAVLFVMFSFGFFCLFCCLFLQVCTIIVRKHETLETRQDITWCFFFFSFLKKRKHFGNGVIWQPTVSEWVKEGRREDSVLGTNHQNRAMIYYVGERGGE